VVDNASADGTVELIKSSYPFVKLIKNTDNKGFASANNQGAAVSTGEYLLFLNPDTIVLPDSLNKLVEFLDDNPDVSMCGPRMLNEDKTLRASVRNFPSFRGVLYRYTILKYLGLFKSNFEKWHHRNFDYEKQSDIEQLVGAAMLIRKKVFEQIGGFDERFFMYYEEVDLCYRLKSKGHRIVYYPKSEIIHLGGKSTDQIPAKTRFIMLRSLLLYFRKHYSRISFAMLSLLFKLGVLSRQIYELLVYYIGYRVCRITNNNARAQKNYLRYKSAKDFLNSFYIKFLLC
jgi:GT2 family glycosyltransferase